MDSNNEESLKACHESLKKTIGSEIILPSNLNLEPWMEEGKDVEEISHEDSDIGRKVKESLRIINEALDRYGPSRVCIAFNGGKDCTAILHLYFAVLCGRGQKELNSIYIESNSEDLFIEMEDFLNVTHERYSMKVTRQDGDIKTALQKIKDSDSKLDAILMGTRIDDPHGKYVSDFSPTDVDKGWPEFMRVNPILGWKYEDVWQFIRRLHLPYCVLYDRGYTSLGSRKSTIPNPELKVVDENGKISYRPAYTLKKNSSERSGRN